MKPKRRVAITGIGLVTPTGNDVPSTWAALQAGRSGAGPITTFDASGFDTRIGAEVKDFDASARVEQYETAQVCIAFASVCPGGGDGSPGRCRDPARGRQQPSMGLQCRCGHDGGALSTNCS